MSEALGLDAREFDFTDSDDVSVLEFSMGAVVDSTSAAYIVVGVISECSVYKVRDSVDLSRMYALKVEETGDPDASKLKMEIEILTKALAVRSKSSHFLTIADHGNTRDYSFLVLQLAGSSLSDLKAARKNKIFSIGTGINAATQCLEAIEDIHSCGFVHRDIKPSNFAVGLADKIRVLYILDFAVARKIFNDKMQMKAQRKTVHFKGTVMFASIAAHMRVDVAPKDDCESWFYLLFDLIVSGGLPWRHETEMQDVLRVKKDIRQKIEQLFGSFACKQELGWILKYFDSLTYDARVSYKSVYEKLRSAAKVCKVKSTDRYDWE